MEQLLEYWPQYVVSNAIALTVLMLACRKPAAARIGLGVILVLASIVNASTASTTPDDYLMYREFAVLDIYAQFIDGWFSENAQMFVLLIAAAQFAIGASLLVNRLLKVSIIGAIVFFIAIVPLGIGSAFPCTLLLATASGMVLWKTS